MLRTKRVGGANPLAVGNAIRLGAALGVAAALAFGASAHAAEAKGTPESKRLRAAGLVLVKSRAPTVRVLLLNATNASVTGAPLPGYCDPTLAYLRLRPAKALAAVERQLARRGLGLLAYDAYRPVRATEAMVRWAESTGHEELLNGYLARRSNHNTGTAVDLTLVKLRTGWPLNMGTPVPVFTPAASTENATGQVLRNRLLLRTAMEAEGFANYRREWWHYDSPSDTRAQPLDIPLGCAATFAGS